MTPRRILFINYEYPPVGGGGGNAMRHIAREMARRGHAPFVLTAAQGGLPELDVSEGVTVRRIPALRRRGERSSIPEMIAFMAAATLAAPGYARQWRIDAVIAFFTLPSGPPAWLLRRTNKLPYVIALRGGDVPGFDPLTMRLSHALTGGVIRWLWHDADAVIANSQGLAEMARAHDPEQTVGVIPQGADTAGKDSPNSSRQAPALIWCAKPTLPNLMPFGSRSRICPPGRRACPPTAGPPWRCKPLRLRRSAKPTGR